MNIFEITKFSTKHIFDEMSCIALGIGVYGTDLHEILANVWFACLAECKYMKTCGSRHGIRLSFKHCTVL